MRSADQNLMGALVFLMMASNLISLAAFIASISIGHKSTLLGYSGWDIGWIGFDAIGGALLLMLLYTLVSRDHHRLPS